MFAEITQINFILLFLITPTRPQSGQKTSLINQIKTLECNFFKMNFCQHFLHSKFILRIEKKFI